MATFLNAEFIKVNSKIHNSDQVLKNISSINKKIESFKGLGLVDKIEAVNNYFNELITYTEDIVLYGKEDHIASVEETVISLKGDCDDYAMAKMQALIYLGFNKKDLELAVVRHGKINHMKLYLTVKGHKLVLDNINKKLRALTPLEEKREKFKVNSAIYVEYFNQRFSKNKFVSARA